MGQCIRKFSDGSSLEYDNGSFDCWCVYIIKPDGSRIPPTDVVCFSLLKRLSKKFEPKMLYDDYVAVYDLIGQSVDDSVLGKIADISVKYGADSLRMEKLLSTLYLTTMAEENKEGTMLGKRIKRLGVYSALIENKSAEYAANFTRNMPGVKIAELCTERGF